MTTRTRTVGRILLELVLSVALVAILFWSHDLGDALTVLRAIRWGFVIPAMVLVVLSNIMQGLRWWLLLRRVGTVPLRDAILLLIAATGLGLILPFRMGAVLQLQVLRHRYGIDRVVVAGTLMGEGLIDVSMLVVLTLAGLPLLGLDTRVLVSAVLLAVLAGSLVAAILLVGGRAHQWTLPLPSRARTLVEDVATDLALGLGALSNPRTAALLLLPTMGTWALMMAAHWLAGQAVGLRAPAYVFLAVDIVASVATIVPLTQLNIGPYELAAHETVVAFGAPHSHATAFAIVTHVVVIVAVALSGLVAAWMLRLRREDIFYLRGGDKQD